MTDPIRIAISGAAGNVCYSLIFRIAGGGMFGKDTPVELSLLDLPQSWSMLRADAMELHDGGFPLLHDVQVETTPTRAFEGADWVILLGSKPMKFADSTGRIEAIRSNTPMIVEHARAINEACPNARILVVADPCNTNALIASQFAHDVPREHWFALNRVDRMRAVACIADKAGVPVREVNRVMVWGNRSASVFVDYHNAFIGDRPLLEVIHDLDWCRGELQTLRRHADQRGLRPAGPLAGRHGGAGDRRHDPVADDPDPLRAPLRRRRLSPTGGSTTSRPTSSSASR